MAKPEPLPVIKGLDAKKMFNRLSTPHVVPTAKALYRGALSEYHASERKGKSNQKSD